MQRGAAKKDYLGGFGTGWYKEMKRGGRGCSV